MQRYVFLHVAATLTNCFVKKNARGAYLRVERHVQNTDKHLLWNFFQK